MTHHGLAAERTRALLRHLVGRNEVPSALDFKLGIRMLRKHPGLALVGGPARHGLRIQPTEALRSE